MKLFSWVALVFLPPTLVAGVFGMNFDHMPELHWLHGYPWALALMVASAVLPVVVFQAAWLDLVVGLISPAASAGHQPSTPDRVDRIECSPTAASAA